jgi:hypothetical protein
MEKDIKRFGGFCKVVGQCLEWTGQKDKNGYGVFYYKQKQRKAHRVSYYFKFGDIPKGMVIDHLDGNPLNNQKKNLRICTHSENMRNRNLYVNNTSGFKGVYWHKTTKKWMSYIRINKKSLYLGIYTCPIDAAKAYNDAALKYHGEFAHINKID